MITRSSTVSPCLEDIPSLGKTEGSVQPEPRPADGDGLPVDGQAPIGGGPDGTGRIDGAEVDPAEALGPPVGDGHEAHDGVFQFEGGFAGRAPGDGDLDDVAPAAGEDVGPLGLDLHARDT